MTKKQNKVKKENCLEESSSDISDLSIPELARLIENQTVNSKMLDKTVLEKLAVHYKSRRGYKKEDIAEILQVCSRTVERYIANVRVENSLKIGANFQNELLGEMLSNSRLRYQRLWRLSYSDNLSDYEKTRIIFMCDQIEMNEATLLSRLGYLSKEQGLDAIESVKKEVEEMDRGEIESLKKRMNSMNSQQWQNILDVSRAMGNERGAVIGKMIEGYEAENEKQKTIT